MCEDCGCGITDHTAKPPADPIHSHSSNPALTDTETVSVLHNILHENNHQAGHIRKHFSKKNVYAVNLMGSPGCGKTSLLEETAKRMKDEISVIEGDLETSRDAERLKACGVRAYQIQTGSTCHLDAFMIHDALHQFNPAENGILFIENVGNLVCPAAYDTGAHLNAVMLSVPEGDDKIAKYPVIFRNADVLIVSKVDLMEHLDFDIERVKHDFRKLNKSADYLEISSKDEKSISRWIEYIQMKRNFHG